MPWQRCQFHLQQNAQAYVPKKSMAHEVAEDIRDVFGAPDRHRAGQRLKETVTKYAVSTPPLASWMEADERWLTGKRYLKMNTGVND